MEPSRSPQPTPTPAPLTINNGSSSTQTVTLSGANGALPPDHQRHAQSRLEINLDSTVTDNSDRLPNTVPITLHAATLQLTGKSSTTSSETIGSLLLADGQCAVSTSPGSSGMALLTIGTLNRSAGATCNFNRLHQWPDAAAG